MNTQTYNIAIDFNQILDLVKQLPVNEKMKIGQELQKDFIDSKLSYLLNAFQTEQLSQDTIDEEVEKVRAEIYARRS